MQFSIIEKFSNRIGLVPIMQVCQPSFVDIDITVLKVI